MRRFLKAVFRIIVVLVAVLLVLPWLLYVPAIQQWACAEVVALLNSQPGELHYSVGTVRLSFPLNLSIEEVTARGASGDTLVSAERLATGIWRLPVFDDEVALSHVEVEGLVMQMDSLTERIALSGRLQTLSVRGLVLDLEAHRVGVGELSTEGACVAMTLRPSLPDTTESEPGQGWLIEVETLALSQTEYLLQIPASGFFLHTAHDRLDIASARVATDTLNVDVADVSMEGAMCVLDLDSSMVRSPWFDYDHMAFTQLDLWATDVHYSSDSIVATLRNLAGEERNSGTLVRDLRADFLMAGSFIRADRFYLATSGSTLRGEVALDYEYFTAPHTGSFRVRLRGEVASDDVVCHVAPYLPAFAQYWPAASCRLDIDAYATEDTLRMPRCEITMPGHVKSQMTARGTSPYDATRRDMDITWEAALTRADFLLSLFVEDAAMRGYVLPDSIALRAEGGVHNRHYFAETAVTHKENTCLEATASLSEPKMTYRMTAAARRLPLAEFCKDIPLLSLSASTTIEGQGDDWRDTEATLDAAATIDTMTLTDGTTFCDFQAVAHLADGQYRIGFDGQDPKAKVGGGFAGVYRRDTVSLLGELEVDNLQMSLLSAFRTSPTRCSLHADVSAESDWADRYALRLTMDTLAFRDAERYTPFTDIRLNFQAAERYMGAVLSGGDCDATLQMDCGIREVGRVADSVAAAIAHLVDDISIDVATVQRLIPTMDLRVSMQQDNPFYPFIEYAQCAFSDFGLHLNNHERLSLSAIVLNGEYRDLQLDTLRCDLTPNDEAYDYRIDAVHSAPVVRHSFAAHAVGRVWRDSLQTHFRWLNAQKEPVYDVAVTAATTRDTLTLRITDDPIVYAQPLTVNRDNFIRFTSLRSPDLSDLGVTGLLSLTGPEGLEAWLRTTSDTTHGKHLTMRIRHLDLGYLGETMRWTDPAAGIVDADGRLFVSSDSLWAEADVWAQTFRYASFEAETLHGHGRLTRARGLTGAVGRFLIDDTPVLTAAYDQRTASDGHDSLRAAMTLDHFPLALANVYLPNEIRLDGKASGCVNYALSTDDHGKADGHILFSEAHVAYTDAGAVMSLADDTLRLADNVLKFDGFNLRAAGGNPMKMVGLIDFSEALTTPRVDLSLRGNDVQLFDSEHCDTRLQSICGTLPVNLSLRLVGIVPTLKLTGTVSALSNSELTYYMKDDPLTSARQLDQLVEFVSFDKLNRRSTSRLLALEQVDDDGFEMDIRMDIARNTALYIYLSTNSDDNISVRGGGALRFAMDAGGNTTLNGSYDISTGDVTFKLPMLPMSKSFKIVEGSTLTWNGPLDDPEMNITATEEVRCTINDESGGSRVVKFLVYVYIRNTMQNLAVTFSCTSPEDASIQSQLSTLTDEELSKQALQLLIAQTYTGPGVTSASSLASANAAINALLQKEVESFLNQRFKNTEVAVGIDTYDADGTGTSRTDYSVKISQRLLNNRMRIVLGGRVSSGENSGAKDDDAIINDFSLEWLLKEDGSHYIHIFRKTNYESILEGEVVETGVGYVMQRSAYRFRDLFIPDSERRRQRMLEKLKEWDVRTPELEKPSVQDTLNDEDKKP